MYNIFDLYTCQRVNCPVFGGTSRCFHSSIELIFTSVPFLQEISPLCPAFFYSMYIHANLSHDKSGTQR